jgi:hypothetical protein
VQTFRKELNDLRQRDIEREASAARIARRSTRGRVSAAVASTLHRIADRLEPAPDLLVETRRIIVRQP